MITTYLTSLKATFNPFSPSSKIPRLFLTLLPANAHKTLQIKSQALPRHSPEPSTLELGFKDGKKGMGEKVSLQDIVEEVNRHARGLARKEELSG
ncbi:hypothetical protein G647_03085 [Cladophialophora carrionii CBS 160.54]|uniref:Large ribosomal subunit protein mL53 n=1 Tax=Cladophialophora carrionii CBS 160.54 TaxID=1279043 RepID=V9DIZ4_9EURO|nr:uncharacterized protein G647_03085 [Cladophialophora carrionii CBS 160.54]ETI26308.1 hypothetical protein G647_03085 [Cladophialophora carrionii CBS 160.54]